MNNIVPFQSKTPQNEKEGGKLSKSPFREYGLQRFFIYHQERESYLLRIII